MYETNGVTTQAVPFRFIGFVPNLCTDVRAVSDPSDMASVQGTVERTVVVACCKCFSSEEYLVWMKVPEIFHAPRMLIRLSSGPTQRPACGES